MIKAACAVLATMLLLPAKLAPAADITDPAPTAKGWAALGQLPDWSGVWVPAVSDQQDQISSNPVPWSPAAESQIKAMDAAMKAGHPKGLFVDCLPEGMPSWMLISHNAMEILFTPGRVTLLGESDGNRLRRIYTDGRTHSTDPDPSFHGESIGHWHAGTLAVDTIGILPQSLIAIDEAVGLPNNGGMHITEHLHLAGPGTLHDDLEITAPKMLTRPWKTTRIYLRRRSRQFQIVEGECLQGSFTDAIDKNGNAVFAPVPQQDGNAQAQ